MVGNVTTFHVDADLVGAGQFDDGGAEIAVATEFTVPSGDYYFRWRHPSATPTVTPRLRVWDASNNLVAGPLAFTTLTPDTWVETSQSALVTLTAGTYRAAVNTTHYVARTGFYTAGSITRSGIIGVRGVFGSSPTSAPATGSTATYLVDIATVDATPEPEPETPASTVLEEPRAGDALHLARVMQEIALACSTGTGLTRFYSYPPATLVAPAGYVSYPSRILYHQTYQRGTADFEDLPVVLVVGRPYEQRARDLVAEWSAADGPTSIVSRLEEWDWTSCDDVTVTSAEFDIERIAGVEYLAVMFKVTAVGPGKD